MTKSNACAIFAFVLLAYGALSSAFQTGMHMGRIPSKTTAYGDYSLIRTAATTGDSEQPLPPVAPKIPDNVLSNNALAEEAGYPAIILSPFPDAADPAYAATAPVGGNEFCVSRLGGPVEKELTNDNLVQIVYRRSNVTDIEVNTLAWKCLGYRFDEESSEWTAKEVFPKWKERYPEPPDMIGMQRIYTKAIDGELIKNNQRLTVSVPLECKNLLKQNMAPYGFTGYKVSELTPNLTRRAQIVNWLLYYREELFGYTVEELREKRRLKKEKEAEEQRKREERNEEEPYRPPLKEVY
ncbi:unnamed protein product [Pseudo-nitzschia multistriata]|uniref:Uncharacterized protein n=1 Tax=Pseudo-nitzschia multistriata TaxID=183589 RepID=A0A448ZHX2_9STRA|nr:unnamed protein product [Pseudo-nitzschia multistriata]